MTDSRSPFDTEDARARISKAVESFVADRRESLLDIDASLQSLHDLLGQFVAGGKRLRPVLAWWGWRAAGGHDSDEAIRAAASLELLQACALIHDDVMDDSDTRRGFPAIHRSVESIHAANQWRGGSESFGVAAAILLGDLCLSWADQLLYESGLPAEALARAKPVYDIMRTELMAGQFLDVVAQVQPEGSPQRALRVARYKSAKYTVERPLHLGWALANGSPELQQALSEYGLALGEAFQLRDDVLGVFGDPQTTGKPAGDDLREGKRNFLTETALVQADPAGRELLQRQLGNPSLDANEIDQLRVIIDSSGALAATEQRIAEQTQIALDALHHADFHNDADVVLTQLAHAATKRSA